MLRKNLQEEWEPCIAQYKERDMTQAKWCEENEQSIHKLKYWLYKIKSQKKNGNEKSNWISMKVEDEIPQDSSDTIKIKIGQATIEVESNFDPTLLANVVKVLKQHVKRNKH